MSDDNIKNLTSRPTIAKKLFFYVTLSIVFTT